MSEIKRISLCDGQDYLDWRQGSGNTVEIYDIAVRSARKCGRGRKMVYDLLDNHLPSETVLVWAITRIDNIIAKQFYEELRFRVVATLWNFYRDSGVRNICDAVMYGKDIYHDEREKR